MCDQRKISKDSTCVFIAVLFAMFFCSSSFACGNKELKTSGGSTAAPDTCEGPDANIECNFSDFPADPGSIMKIAADSEPGTRILITGIITDKNTGKPIPGVKIYAYQTDNNGYYSKNGTETGSRKWHGRLHGWCVTDNEGRYEIHTIRPGRYPEGRFPAHIHWAVKLPGGMTTYLNDFVFSDDEYADEKYLSRLDLPGDNGVIELRQEGNILTASRITPLSTFSGK